MPSLTAKAAAELLSMPAYSQVRVLTEQKYPMSGSQVFRTPYYSAVLTGIRALFRSGKSPSSLTNARSKIESIGQPARRLNNLRVLDAFEASDFSSRDLVLIQAPKRMASLRNVDFRLSQDLRLEDADEALTVYVNCRAQPLDENIARYTLEIAQWVLECNGEPLPLKQFQYVDLATNKTFVFKTRRKRTIAALEENAKIIDAVWPSL